MHSRGVLGTIAFALWVSTAGAQIVDFGKYPDLRGQWVRYGPSGPDLKGPLVRLGPSGVFRTRFDPSEPPAGGQEAPLTPEYQAIFEANLADQAAGGQGTAQTFTCISPGMPRATNGYGEIEFVDLLEVETRGPFRGPRAFDVTGAPLHRDNQTIVKEQIYLDQANADILHDDVTVIDHALTRPWTVHKTYGREPNKEQPFWRDNNCSESNNHVKIGSQNYMLSADGYLMPTRKDQSPPDLRYFNQSQK